MWTKVPKEARNDRRLMRISLPSLLVADTQTKFLSLPQASRFIPNDPIGV